MYPWVVIVFVFCMVLFIYIHVYHHYKTSNDFEIYDIENITKDRLHEICELKQPFIFNFENTDSSIFETNLYKLPTQYDPFELNIRTNTKGQEEPSVDSVPLSLDKSISLFDKSDDDIKYYSEDNYEFLCESGLLKKISTEDDILRPYMGCMRLYDVLTGSVNGYTPLRYEVNDRNYFMVVNGYIDVILIPPKYSKYLRGQPNYETFEFNSLIDVWNVQEKYSQEYKKSKSMNITINAGKVLYIPPYWWYSIRFNNRSSVTSLRYRTYMNNISILPYILTHYLQMFNVKKNIIQNKSITI
jgi:hypothetical protein